MPPPRSSNGAPANTGAPSSNGPATGGTLGTLDTQPSGTAADFYKNNPADVYAKVIHDNMVDGKAYAFAFDDVQNQESLVHDGDPRLAAITMTPF